MELRLIEVTLERTDVERSRHLIERHNVHALWSMGIDDNLSMFRFITPANQVEAITDELTTLLAGHERSGIVVSSVEALIPSPTEPEQGVDETPDSDAPGSKKKQAGPGRISRDELYADVEPGTRLSRVYLLTTFLSALVAAVGLMRDDVAVVIGAMVIAPLLKPNIALALATTLGDSKLGWEAMKANLGAAAVVLITSFTFGLLFTSTITADQVLSRTTTDLGDIVLAGCAGTAGALAFTSGVPATLIGVMVAVALLPPLVCVGLLLAAQEWALAAGASCLLVINIACVNITAVVTFLVQGIRPMQWWEADRAKKATHRAILFWGMVLATLAVAIILKP